jgi:predicted nucleic acid-binding protein
MRVRALADTGALLAYLDRKDKWHTRCREAFEQGLLFPLLTSTAVLTELFHLARGRKQQLELVWELARSGALRIVPMTDADMPPLEALMLRYRDRPMDLADATLVRIAERESILTVFTTDNDDFETYRAFGRRRFRVLPGRPSRS